MIIFFLIRMAFKIFLIFIIVFYERGKSMGNEQYSNLQCPECEKIGDYVKNSDGEIYCIHCGLVIKSPYPFTAGIRFKTLTEILDEKELEKINEKRRRKEHERIKKFQKI